MTDGIILETVESIDDLTILSHKDVWERTEPLPVIEIAVITKREDGGRILSIPAAVHGIYKGVPGDTPTEKLLYVSHVCINEGDSILSMPKGQGFPDAKQFIDSKDVIKYVIYKPAEFGQIS